MPNQISDRGGLAVTVSPEGTTEPLNLDPGTDIGQAENASESITTDPAIDIWKDAISRLEKRDTIRTFESGATRDVDDNKLDYEGFLSPLVLQAFGQYMHQHRLQKDGSIRSSDNWQKGMGLDVYLKSLIRHVMDLWLMSRTEEGQIVRPDGEVVELEDALGGIFFNVQGYWHEVIQEYGE